MINPTVFVDCLNEAGYLDFVGVPCSLLQPLFAVVQTSDRCRYIAAASEGEALAIAVGLGLAGRKCAVLLQNSGLGNVVNPLTSLAAPLEVPVLLIVGMRGAPGSADSLEHDVMGRIARDLLALLSVQAAALPHEIGAAPALLRAVAAARPGSYAILVGKGVLGKPNAAFRFAVRDSGDVLPPAARLTVQSRPYPNPLRHQRIDFIELLARILADEAAVIATTGGCWKELRQHRQSPCDFYQMGSMGCASAIGLGVALASRRTVVVLDGDGAALMKLGNMSTIGVLKPDNLIHLVFDNGQYESTGGQPSAAATVDFPAVALACGYPTAVSCVDPDAFEAAVVAGMREPRTTFVHVPVRTGCDRPARPHAVDFVAQTRAFSAFLRSPPAVHRAVAAVH